MTEPIKSDDPFDPMTLACVELLGRTGAEDFQLRYQDDQEPTVWMAVAKYMRGGEPHYEAAGGMSPSEAAFRLCEVLIDGGTCTHCGRPTGILTDDDESEPTDVVCWYRLIDGSFQRACRNSG